LAVLCRPGLALPKTRLRQVIFFAAIALAAGVLIALRFHVPVFDQTLYNWYNWAVAAPLVLSVLFWRFPLPFAPIVAFVLALQPTIDDVGGVKLVRSFFGVHRISESPDRRFRLLLHGTTLHGAQQIRVEGGRPFIGQPEPVTYYHRGGGLAQAI